MSDLTSVIVETMAQPVLVLDEDLSVAMANGAFLEGFQVNLKDTIGEYVFDLGNGQWDIPALRQLLKELLENQERIEDFRVEHDFEKIGRRTMVVNARRLGQDGHKRLLLAIQDVTEKECWENELIARREFADKLIDSIREGLVVMAPDLRVERVNQSFCEMFRIDPESAEGSKIYNLGNGQWDIPELRELLEDILPAQNAFDDFEVTHTFPEIGRRTMRLNARQLDHMPRILLAIRDQTEERRHAEDQKMLIGELQHRVKNILANVQSIANATRRRSNSLDEFGESFTQRLQSLARAQDLLMRGPRGVVDMKQLLEQELEAHGWEEDGRLSFDGPTVKLTRGQTQPVAMVFHEMATNAIKYGAFSGERGRLDVSWALDDSGWLQLDWHEKHVSLAGRQGAKGFGSRMIESSIQHSLNGKTTLEYAEDGLRCHMAFPIDREAQATG